MHKRIAKSTTFEAADREDGDGKPHDIDVAPDAGLISIVYREIQLQQCCRDKDPQGSEVLFFCVVFNESLVSPRSYCMISVISFVS